jgi:DNA mismatch endonuclease, patch repair protein
MSRIRGADTRPESRLRKELWKRGLRYRVSPRLTFGKPDLALPGPRIAIFIDGCFWHGCPDHYYPPKTRAAFWAKKLKDNVERDRRQLVTAEQSGWRVLRVWEHDIREDPAEAAERLLGLIASGATADHWHVYAVAPGPDGAPRERRIVELRGGSERTSSDSPRPAPASQRLA